MGFAINLVALARQRLLLLLVKTQAFFNVFTLIKTADPRCNGPGHHCRGEFGHIGQQVCAVLVKFTDHPRPLVDGPVVELTSELVFDD